MKRDTGKKDNKSSRLSFGSIIKYLKTSRGRMMFETCVLLLFCAALLISGSVSLAWFSVSRANTQIGQIKIKNPYFSVDYTVHPVRSISGNTYTFGDYEEGSKPHLPEYDRYGLNYSESEELDYAVVIEFSFKCDNDQNIIWNAEASGEWATGINNYLSNCVEITDAVVSGSDVTVGTDTWHSFVTMSKDINNKVTGLNGSKKTSLGERSYTVSESNDRKLWFVMRYNKEAVDYISSLNVKEITSDMSGSQIAGDSVKFSSDIVFNINGGDN